MDEEDGFRRLTLGIVECIRRPMGEKKKLMLVGAGVTTAHSEENVGITLEAVGKVLKNGRF
jgi:hypothetical protein